MNDRCFVGSHFRCNLPRLECSSLGRDVDSDLDELPAILGGAVCLGGVSVFRCVKPEWNQIALVVDLS